MDSFNLLRYTVGTAMLNNAKIKLDIHKDTRELLDSNNTVFVASNHKSMWETAGLPVTIHKEFNKKIVSGAGQALFKGLSKKIMNLGTTFNIEKDKKTSALSLIEEISKKLDANNSMLVFPEGTRSRDGHLANFKSSIFQAPLNTENKVYIIPADVTYPQIPELKLFDNNEKYSFSLKHVKYLLAKLDPVVVSLGEPLLNTDFQNRKELSDTTRQLAKELVHVHPTNIFAHAYKQNGTLTGDSIDNTINQLTEKTKKFTHLPYKSVVLNNTKVSLLAKESDLDFYANQISHYTK